MTNCSIAERNLILETLKSKEASQGALEGVLDIVIASGGIKYVEDLAKNEAHSAMKCLNKLAASEYRHSLEKMVDFSINRRT
jgi:octaprenyl-diphosphate synthase